MAWNIATKIKFRMALLHHDTQMRGEGLAGSNGNRKAIFSPFRRKW